MHAFLVCLNGVKEKVITRSSALLLLLLELHIETVCYDNAYYINYLGTLKRIKYRLSLFHLQIEDMILSVSRKSIMLTKHTNCFISGAITSASQS